VITTPLTELRSRIEACAVTDGTYVVVCARTGDRPVPVEGLRFPDRETAARAATLAERYRAVLRRYDSRVPYYDPVVSEAPALESVPSDHTADRPWAFPPVHGEEAAGRIEFCHRVASAVFETLAEHGRDGVERAVMDAYLGAAERIHDRDALCLCLLERMAAELDERLSAREQVTVLEAAAARVPASDRPGRVVTAAFDRLAGIELLDSYTASPWIDCPDDRSRRCHVSVTDYALSPSGKAVPTLPISVSLLGRSPDRSLDVSTVTRVDGSTLRFTLTADTAEPTGLTTAPLTGDP